MRERCLPSGMNDAGLKLMDQLITSRRSVRRGQYLFRAGEAFKSLYAIRLGFFKTFVTAKSGREQVTGFQMAGELMGLDGISTTHHACHAIALEDSQVCAIHYEDLEALSSSFPPLLQQFHRLMSREILRDQSMMMVLAQARAEERVANFVLNLAQRLRLRGYSASNLVLRMSRDDIGNYLGLTLETVSRTFSRLQDEGVLAVKYREISILNTRALIEVASRATDNPHP